jgi:hypothetical protein
LHFEADVAHRHSVAIRLGEVLDAQRGHDAVPHFPIRKVNVWFPGRKVKAVAR